MIVKFKKVTAALLSAVMIFSASGSFPVTNAETNEEQTYTLSYNLDEDGLVTEDYDIFVPITGLKAGDSVTIADGLVEKEGYTYTGWTADDIFLYTGGDNFIMPDHDVVLDAVWYDNSSDVRYSIDYKVEIDGVLTDTSKELPTLSLRPGQYVYVSLMSYSRTGYEQHGWTDGTNNFLGQSKMIVHDHDVTLEPYWLKYYGVTYDAGDVGGIIGNQSYYFLKLEDCSFELANNSRLVRMGYNLKGWTSDYDGQNYSTLAQYMMPSCDVVFTAIWQPITYTVVFKVNNGTSSTIKIAGETDTAIIAPECTATYEGYKFAGWCYDDSEIYQPGEEFVIPGAMPGLGIMLKGVWVEDTGDKEEAIDVYSLINARQAYLDGEITEDELIDISDYILM